MSSQNDYALSRGDRRRNSYGLNVSDNEKAILEKRRQELGLSKNDFIRAGLEMICGCKVFRESHWHRSDAQ